MDTKILDVDVVKEKYGEDYAKKRKMAFHSLSKFDGIDPNTFEDKFEIKSLTFDPPCFSEHFSEMNLSIFKLPELIELHLIQSPLTKLISPSDHMLNNLRVLNLFGNKLKDIDDDFCFPALEELNLGGNYINEIREGMFDGVPQLRVLNLSANGISNIPREVLENLPRLRELRLNSNKLKELNCNLESLQILDLASNDFTEMNAGSLGYFPELKQLNLSFNKIERFPFYILNKFYNLTHIDLSANKLAEITRGTFNNLYYLQSCDLSRNEMDEVDPLVFEDQTFAGDLGGLQEIYIGPLWKNNEVKKYKKLLNELEESNL